MVQEASACALAQGWSPSEDEVTGIVWEEMGRRPFEYPVEKAS